MPAAIPEPDAREVERINALIAPDTSGSAEAFLDRCRVGSTWTVHIRTAEVVGRVIDRGPLGLFPERDCLCVSLRLDRVVPVEPGLRFRMVADDDGGLIASGVIRPWGG